MKRCPQCGAEYDDYVQYCFVDGAELTEAAVAPPPVAKPIGGGSPRSTPVPPPPAQPPPRPVPAPPPPVHRPVQETARGLSIWALVLLFMFVIALFGVGGVVGALFLIGGGAGPTAQPVDAPRPPPIPPPVPLPSDAPASGVKVRFESDPQGAAVWEQNTLLCAATPCDVDHPDVAPEVRHFVLKLDGFPDSTHTMTDPSAIQNIEFLRSARPRPPKPRGGGDDILIQR